MERTTVQEYTIRIATEDESNSIITLLKEVAKWLQHKKVDQWQYLLGEEATTEILEGIKEKYTYVVMKEEEIVGTVTASPKQMNGRNIFLVKRKFLIHYIFIDLR